MAFVGQATFFAACVPTADDDALVTTFVEFRQGFDPRPMRAALDAFAPDVVVAFRPEVFPPGVLADVPAAVVGFLTEPMPRHAPGGGASHPDLVKRARDLEGLDPRNVDRVVCFDPLIVPAADPVVPVWRALPLPVADRLFRDRGPVADPPRTLFVGRSTPHREAFLRPAERVHDLLHVAFGVAADDLERLMDEHDVAINLHNEPYPSFENRVCLHLAAGHLVITEPLSPMHGLEGGIDLLEVSTPDGLQGTIEVMHRYPGVFHKVRVRGRRKAELYRASRVWPRLVADLLADIEAFGA
jgi:hypothetical protein